MDYVDWLPAGRVAFPSIKPSMRTISLRLPVPMINRLKSLANQRDVPSLSIPAEDVFSRAAGARNPLR